MERALKDKQSVEKQRQDRMISSVSQTLTTAVNSKLDKLVRSEMKSQVVPGTRMQSSMLTVVQQSGMSV